MLLHQLDVSYGKVAEKCLGCEIEAINDLASGSAYQDTQKVESVEVQHLEHSFEKLFPS